jgi:transposase
MDARDHHSLEELKRIERTEKDAGRSKRLRIVILAIEGWTAPAIATSVGLSRRVCQGWLYRYNEHGLKGLEDLRGGNGAASLTEQQARQFQQRVEAGPTPEDRVCSLRGKDFQKILKVEFGVLRSLSSVYHLLHRFGYSCLRPRPKHRKMDAEIQAAFREQLPGRLAQIAAEHPDKRLRVYFEDEARFGQQGTLTRVWAKRGSRPTAVRQTEYGYLWVLGAVCAETGHAEGLLSPRLNAATINLFLQQFSDRIAPQEHAVLIWDGAGFHRSKALRVPPNITLIQLPAYSPELNPIENLWGYLKSHYWSNKVHADYDDLEKAAINAWRTAVLNPQLMKTVCAADYVKRAGSS